MVEANPDTFGMLRDNVALNEVRNCELHHLAASNKAETIRLLKNTVNSGGSKRYPLNPDPDYFEDDPEIAGVWADRLDSALPEAQPRLILMDIEGSEYFALQGMDRLLTGAKHLIIEFIPYHLTDVAGVTPEDFGRLIMRYFDRMYVPRMSHTFEEPHVIDALRVLFEAGESDPGLVFSK